MNRSVLIAIVIVVVAVGWMLSGTLLDEVEGDTAGAVATEGAPAGAALASPEPSTHEKQVMSVRTRISTAEPHDQHLVVRGRTEAVRTVMLAAETQGRVEKIYKGKGEYVRRGDPIAKLAAGARDAQMIEAEALIRQRQIEYEAALKLNQKGYRADTQLAAAQAALDSAKAAKMSMSVDIDYLTIRAPFDGVISEKPVELGAFLKVGEPVARVVDQDPVLAIGFVSEREIARVEEGVNARVKLVDGTEHTGRIRYVAPIADASTRTFKVEVELDNPDRSIPAGVTAEISIAAGSVPAHFLTPAILTLNDAGEVGVRVIGPGNRVAFVPVSIVADQTDGVWVSGLPVQAEIIVVGQEFVREGEVVKIAKAE
ncbi:MAG: efflux RND transporter periplasmic adaptor subunit [Pseudomonadota bacterium]|nr:efflux RND transporter periplasmic adaptor subunit [Pseudomonadota bacterium]